MLTSPTIQRRGSSGVVLKAELKGLADLTRKLQGRIRRLEQSVLRKALQAYAEPIRAHAEQLARANISPRMKIITKIKIRGSTGWVGIGPSKEVFDADESTATFANIGYWFEFGYEIRATRKGPSLHHVGAKPFLTPAWQAQKERALAAFEQVMRDNLEQNVEGLAA